jgi:hypothetical protein
MGYSDRLRSSEMKWTEKPSGNTECGTPSIFPFAKSGTYGGRIYTLGSFRI